MVVVEHCLNRRRLKKEVDSWLKLTLVNSTGGYFTLPLRSKFSRYDGFFVYDRKDEEMYKIVDSIEIKDFNVNSVVNNFYDFDVFDDKKNKINFFIPNYYDSLVINSNNKKNFTINLDVRKSYDCREWGRHYEFVEENKNKFIIKFTKKKDKREDKAHGMKEFVYYIVISSDGKIEKINDWKKRIYDFDRNRNDDFERFVYSAVNIVNGKNLVVSVSKRKDIALNDNNYVQKNINKLKLKQKQETSDNFTKLKTKTKSKEIDFAYKCCVHNLKNLVLRHGVFAGLPWYYQFWTRDEAISLGALMFFDKRKVKEILMKQIEHILPDGRIPNIRVGGYRKSPLGTADGTGWCVKRLSQTRLDKVERIFVSAKLDYSIKKLMKSHTENGFAVNEKRETWMDTNPNNTDPRDSARIEIQALRLNMYDYLYKLSKDKKYLELEKELRKNVRKEFWDGNILFDGINDKTIRPNIFIAAYVYPKLLTKKEWKKCFENSLPKLWCEWGGLATIDKSDPRFTAHYTGRGEVSYHRGDSWFWVNNLSALVMHKIDKKSFKKYVDKIIKASTHEILFSGMLGANAELSNASTLSSQASLMQAWSMAMFIELINEVFK